MVKAKLAIDCNFYQVEPSKPTISPFEIQYFELQVGDEIIGFQDDQEWEGTVSYDPTYPDEMQWYLDLNNSIEHPVSQERMEGRSEGGRAAMPIGEIRGELLVVEAMLADGMDIDKVSQYTRLSRTRLENIKRRNS